MIFCSLLLQYERAMGNVQSCMNFLALALKSPQSSNIYWSIYQNENSGHKKSRNNILKSIVISQFQIYHYCGQHTERARSHKWMNRSRERQKQKMQNNNNCLFKNYSTICVYVRDVRRKTYGIHSTTICFPTRWINRTRVECNKVKWKNHSQYRQQ